MYKSAQKKVIVLKGTKNRIFEEAYFIIKDEALKLKESDMIREANKIIDETILSNYFYSGKHQKNNKKNNRGFLWFVFGALSSVVLCTLLFCLIK